MDIITLVIVVIIREVVLSVRGLERRANCTFQG